MACTPDKHDGHTGHGWHEFNDKGEMVWCPAPVYAPGEQKDPDWFYMGVSCGQTPAGVNCVCVVDYGMACGPCRAAHRCDCKGQSCDICKLIWGF